MTDGLDQLRNLAAAQRKLDILQLQKAFDPRVTASRPNAQQQSVLDDLGKVPHRYVRGGNQCLAEGTLVATPAGPKPIEEMQPGDTVFDEYGQHIKVKEVFDNGVKEVADISYRGKPWAACTGSHVWYTKSGKGRLVEKAADTFAKNDGIERRMLDTTMGTVSEPHAYAIGALLGDGCSKQPGRQIYISSGTDEVPKKLAAILSGTLRKRAGGNHTWCLGRVECNYYNEWCKDRYAHEKTVDLDTLKTWDRQSLVAFVAGVIDTDGSVSAGNEGLQVTVGMQAKPVIDALEYCILALWQVPATRSVDNRKKYKNGPVYSVLCNNGTLIRRMLREITPHLATPHKRYQPEWDEIVSKRSRKYTISANWGRNKRLVRTYDIHVDSPTNLYCLANGLVTHNSGKSQLGGREISWIFQENHPTWSRPAHWKGPLQILVLSRTSTIVQEEIWEKKIKPFLAAGSYREHRSGGQLYKVSDVKTKNSMLFFSHHSPDEAREKVQAFTAHVVWLDEMPKSVKLIEELHRRVQANQGYFLATFTPKVISKEIRNLIDTPSAVHKVYPLNMLDNPIYAGKEEDILETMKTYSDAYRNTLLTGDWYVGDESVYDFGSGCIRAPEAYHPSWRHLASVDPASSGKTGLILLAEDPKTAAWYVVKSKYLQEKVPSNLVDLVEKEFEGYNIVKRVADSHESWFIGEASKKGYRYGGVWKKNERKKELIKNLQESLYQRRSFVPGWNEDLIDEFNTCMWHETIDGKIVGASRFHLLDAYQYAVDNIPKPSTKPIPKSHDEALQMAHRDRKKREARKAKFGSFRPRGRLYARQGRKVKLG